MADDSASPTVRAPLRLLLVSGEYPPMEGGVADFTRILAEELARLGQEVHVLTARGGTGPGDSPARSHPIMPHWGWSAVAQHLLPLVSRLRPQVVNLQYQTAAYGMHPSVNLLPLYMREAPLVTTFHDLRVPYLFPKAGRLRLRANLLLARRSRAVIVTNPQDRAALRSVRLAQPLHSIPIGSNIAPTLPEGYDRAAWRQRWGIGTDDLVLCYFGFLNASKGGEEIVAALADLAGKGLPVRLLMVGGQVGASDPTNRAYLDTVRRRIGALGLAPRVVWTGYLDPHEVSASLVSSDLCLLPYRDGVSYRRGSFMAALAHGLAVVTTHPQVTLPELAHGQNVWLVPPMDADALIAACQRLWRDAELRQRLGRGARELHEKFQWPQIAARTLEVFYGVAGR